MLSGTGIVALDEQTPNEGEHTPDEGERKDCWKCVGLGREETRIQDIGLLGRRCAMRDLFYLSETQFSRIKPYFPLSHGVPRVDDLRVIAVPAAREDECG